MLVAIYLGSPLQPEFEDVVMTSALNHFIPGVVLHVVQLVWHEQILGGHLVAANQQFLENKETNASRTKGERVRLACCFLFFQLIFRITMCVSSRVRESF